MKVKIIAEAGVNHNGDLLTAKKLVTAAAQAGVDVIKFQSFKASKSIAKNAKKAVYQQKNIGSDGTQLEMVEKLELSRKDHVEIIKQCEADGVNFMSTAFDIESLDMLHELNVTHDLKIPSGEVTNVPLLRKFCKYNFENIYLSTGMCNLGDIENALNVILDQGVNREKITLLHCTTEYPAPVDEINLRAIKTLRDAFHLAVGYSDHSEGLEIPFAAVAMGASVIEKHFTLDQNMYGPDHKASLEPNAMKNLVNGIRRIEQAMGSPLKMPTRSEISNIISARKSIVALTDINPGDIFSEENITTKRPGDGLSADNWDLVMGKVAGYRFEKDEQIKL